MATVFKRPPQTEGGKPSWGVTYYNADGKRTREFFTTKADAEDRRIEVEAKLRTGTFISDSDSITVAQAGVRFIKSRERLQREETTIRGYRQHLHLHIEPFIGNIKLSRLTSPKVVAFREDMLETDRSIDMVGRILRTLSMILNFAKEEGYVAENNAKGVSVVKGRRGKSRITVPEKADLERLQETAGAKDDNGFRQAWLLTHMTAGLRSSEGRALRWDNVHLGRGAHIYVEERADRWCKVGPVKSDAGEREIPLMDETVLALKRWKLACPRSDTRLVFPTESGRIWHYHNFYHRVWVPLCRDAGLVTPIRDPETGKQGTYKDGRLKWTPTVSMHQLRHVAASLLIELNTQPKRLQEIMGHANIDMTYNTYGHLWKDEVSDDELRRRGSIWLRTSGIVKPRE